MVFPVVTSLDVIFFVVVVDVVVVDVDVDVSSTVPSTIVSPAATPCSSQSHSYTEGESSACDISGIDISRVRVNWGSIHYDRVVGGNINHLGICLLNDDYLVAFIRGCYYGLL